MILVLNCGSTSIKYKLFSPAAEEEGFSLEAKGSLERLGSPEARLHHQDHEREINRDLQQLKDHTEGLKLVSELVIKSAGKVEAVSCVSHRVVHGGEIKNDAVIIDDYVLDKINAYAPLAPLHNPANLAGIRAACKYFPQAAQVAVLDTAFHQTMPAVAYLYALPYHMYERHGIRRYGFHGISHSYVSKRASELLRQSFSELRMITCHLGAGCSMAAVKNGQCLDTSMGFTPLEGLVMATRTGDIDPSIIYYLTDRLGMGIDEVFEMLNESSGLLGISGSSKDIRDLLKESQEGRENSTLALAVFSYRTRKYIGAYAAVLGGMEALVFTGGIGENSPEMRRSICEGLDFLGVLLEEKKNLDTVEGKEGAISPNNSPVKVLVIPTDEEKAMAIKSWDVLREFGGRQGI